MQSSTSFVSHAPVTYRISIGIRLADAERLANNFQGAVLVCKEPTTLSNILTFCRSAAERDKICENGLEPSIPNSDHAVDHSCTMFVSLFFENPKVSCNSLQSLYGDVIWFPSWNYATFWKPRMSGTHLFWNPRCGCHYATCRSAYSFTHWQRNVLAVHLHLVQIEILFRSYQVNVYIIWFRGLVDIFYKTKHITQIQLSAAEVVHGMCPLFKNRMTWLCRTIH